MGLATAILTECPHGRDNAPRNQLALLKHGCRRVCAHGPLLRQSRQESLRPRQHCQRSIYIEISERLNDMCVMCLRFSSMCMTVSILWLEVLGPGRPDYLVLFRADHAPAVYC
jgi:hypothetical protein